MQRTLWFFVTALLAVDITLLVQRRQSDARFEALRTSSASAVLKARYADEEESLLTGTEVLPATFPRLTGSGAGEAVQFVLLTSIGDCTNCVEDEVARLNQIALRASARLAGIEGFFAQRGRPEMARRFIAHLDPAPRFPLSVQDALPALPGATTPLVLVVRSRDGRILDAHKPIPEDLTRRDAFYARWAAILGLS